MRERVGTKWHTGGASSIDGPVWRITLGLGRKIRAGTASGNAVGFLGGWGMDRSYRPAAALYMRYRSSSRSLPASHVLCIGGEENNLFALCVCSLNLPVSISSSGWKWRKTDTHRHWEFLLKGKTSQKRQEAGTNVGFYIHLINIFLSLGVCFLIRFKIYTPIHTYLFTRFKWNKQEE
jgi:hypothetical protein